MPSSETKTAGSLNTRGTCEPRGKTPRIFSWDRPDSYWDVIGKHFPLSLIAGIPVFMSVYEKLDPLLIKPCTFLSLTGYPCPFCGFTRSFRAIGSGDLSFAFYNCPLACLLFSAFAAVAAWNISALILGVRINRGSFFQLRKGRGKWVVITVSALFLINWAYRLSQGLK